jgi:hypothetical protein
MGRRPSPRRCYPVAAGEFDETLECPMLVGAHGGGEACYQGRGRPRIRLSARSNRSGRGGASKERRVAYQRVARL